MKTLVTRTLLITGFLFVSHFIQSQSIYPISVNENDYQGSGVKWIIDRADSCQFVLFGEQHGVKGVAEFVIFINKQLDKKGFDYLALETDGWTTSKSAKLGIDKFTRKYPHSIAFDSNGDLELMQSAVDMHPDLETPIWGLDQMQTAIHPFQRLIELANTNEQKKVARGAFLKATLKMGRYTRQNHQKDLEVLKQVFEGNPSEEKDQILKELQQTMEIFTKWMDPNTRQESVAIREELMKANLDNYLKSDPDAKVLFKIGGAHTMYGVGPNGVLTLGDHVQKIAKQNGQKTLSISIRRYNPENAIVPDSVFNNANMILIDSKKYLQTDPETSFHEELTMFDAIIYLKDAGYAGKSINRTYEKAFRNNFIKSLVPLIICVIVCLITIFVFIIKKIRKKSTSLSIPSIASFLSIFLIVIQILKMRSAESAAVITTSMTPLLIHVSFGIFGLYFIYQSLHLFKNEGVEVRHKIFYALFTISFLVLSYSIHYWNIGGMLWYLA
ncbi:hypothetical protein [Ekhidna sp.]|uniref:hypothetical protein n=1 Tax=Ekhidna sp. TaxID=2608089 RepID=UPI003C7AA4C8